MRQLVCILIFVSVCSSSLVAQEKQQFQAGLQLGLAASQISGDNLAGFDKAGLQGGIFVETWFNEKWGGTMEMQYIMKGSRRVPKAEEGNQSYTLRLSYVEVPFLARVKLGPFVYEMGPTVGVLVNSNEEVNEIEILNPRPFKRLEIGGSAGLGYPIKEKIFFTIRGSSSLLPVRDHANGSAFRWNLGQYNAVLSFLFKYRF